MQYKSNRFAGLRQEFTDASGKPVLSIDGLLEKYRDYAPGQPVPEVFKELLLQQHEENLWQLDVANALYWLREGE